MTKLSTILRRQMRRPFDDNDCVTLTPAGEAALDAANAALEAAEDAVLPPGCPRCSSALGAVNLYHGGRGYVPYDVCTNPLCGFRRRT